MNSDFARVFSPRSVALVGVSGRAGSMTSRPLTFLLEHGFQGAIYPVNPGYESIAGHRCYASLDAVPPPVDLVLIMVPAAAGIDAVRAAGVVGAAAAVVLASGFSETGAAGVALQARLRAAARQAGVRVLGPNCQGLVYAPARLCATFTSAALRRPTARDSAVAYIGQSGAIGGSIFDLAREMGLGLTAWVSTGNQADLDSVEIAAALVEDRVIRVLMLYIEAIGDGQAYIQLARRARELGKHLVVLRSGLSDAGQRAVASHTGAMLGNGAAFELVCQQYGIDRVDDLDEMLAVAAARAHLAPMAGQCIGVVTTSGGAGSLAADRCVAHGLSLPELGATTQRALAPLIPDFGALANPVDVTAQVLAHGQSFSDICAITGNDSAIDAVIVLLTMVVGEPGRDRAEDLVALARSLDKPVLVAWLAGHELTADGRRVFHDAGLPVFSSVNSIIRAASLLAAPRQLVSNDADGTRIDVAALRRWLEQSRGASDTLLDVLGIARPESWLATSREAARDAVERLDRPVAMKVVARGLNHKSDVGGVALNVDPPRAGEVFDTLMAAATACEFNDIEGVQIQSMVDPGVELVVGATAGEDGFPAIVSVGFGGVTTEILGDTASALAPVSAPRAAAMLRRLRAYPLLAGFRGRPVADVDAAADVIVRVGECMAAAGNKIREFEINPLIVGAEGAGATAVDLLLVAADDAPGK